MTIGSNSLIDFFGTQDSLDNTSSAVTDGSFSAGTSDLSAWTNDDDAPFASITLEGTYSVAPDAGSTVTLFARQMNVQSTNDNEAPDANLPHKILGYFPLNDVTSAQFITIQVKLPNNYSSQVYDFYIQNNAGQTLGAGWDLHVTPMTVGPHA